MNATELKARLMRAIAHMDAIMAEDEDLEPAEHVPEPWCDECKRAVATMKLIDRAIANAK